MRIKGDFKIITLLLLLSVINLSISYPQVPPRLQIPGALLLDGPPQRAPQQRARARIPQAFAPEVRPVIEEQEDSPSPIRFIPSPQLIPTQHLIEVEPEQTREKVELPFRPERPIAPPRQENQRQIQYSQPAPQQRPVIRQELKQQQNYPEVPHLRRPAQQPQIQQQARPQPRPIARPAPQYLDDEAQRTRKPPVQILRKYRTDNADGSITWGYENEDGSFKEETIGIDCITRGKYGYVDPDGVKREYTYETGGTCEEPEEDLDDLPPGQQPPPKGKKTYKPLPQYVN